MLPSAWLHFMMVETLPVPVAALGIVNVHINFIADYFNHVYNMKDLHKVSVLVAQAFYFEPLLELVGSALVVCGGNDHTDTQSNSTGFSICYLRGGGEGGMSAVSLGCGIVDPGHQDNILHPYYIQEVSAARIGCLLCMYVPLAMLFAFYAYMLVSLARERVTDFRSGKYMLFTWSLERNPTRATLALCSGITCVLSVVFVVCVAVFGENAGDINWSVSCMNVAVVAMALLHMRTPQTPVPEWSLDLRFENVVFSRSWQDMFSQSNEVFAAFLQSSLWAAKCDMEASKGSSKKRMKMLRELLVRPKAEEFLSMCQHLQELEDLADSEDDDISDMSTDCHSSDEARETRELVLLDNR
eukprot:TRINITY_DN41559_c0_g1_i1.p1 TRINITY_DN41559_c0_g1~~TRINITY_DN41559_c0_g1_i1.p1  ORF type:complete len:356 (-),score=60.83 TRINITY_DN41559_c0_g1_i1:127-1194(-)